MTDIETDNELGIEVGDLIEIKGEPFRVIAVVGGKYMTVEQEPRRRDWSGVIAVICFILAGILLAAGWILWH